MRLRRLFLALATAATVGLSAPVLAHDDHADAHAIEHLMMATFDKPEARLIVQPITVFEEVAVAGWSQGEMGGRALLRKKHDKWVLTLCSGDALKEAKALQHFGLTAEEAEAMAKAVVEAEAKLDPALVARFASFDGVVMMDEHGNHPPAGGHGGHGKEKAE